ESCVGGDRAGGHGSLLAVDAFVVLVSAAGAGDDVVDLGEVARTVVARRGAAGAQADSGDRRSNQPGSGFARVHATAAVSAVRASIIANRSSRRGEPDPARSGRIA